MNTSLKQNRPGNLHAESSAEQELLACIESQSTVYGSAVLLIETLEKAANRRELGDPDSVSQLQKALNQVVSAQQKVSAGYVQFSSLQASPSTKLRGSLARHEEQLKVLVARIDSLQHIFESIRNDIFPELDTDIRRRSMHSAYQKSLKSV